MKDYIRDQASIDFTGSIPVCIYAVAEMVNALVKTSFDTFLSYKVEYMRCREDYIAIGST